MKISDARSVLQEVEVEKLTSTDSVTSEALESAQQDGIICTSLLLLLNATQRCSL